MSGEDFADFIGARKVDRGKWIARCPAHRDYRGKLIITRGYNRVAQVRCLERCSIDDILESLGLSRREFESLPVPLPDFEEMDVAELKAFGVKRRERQANHAATCEQMRDLKREVRDIRSVNRVFLDDGARQELQRNLYKAERMLSAAKSVELLLRDIDPSSRSEDLNVDAILGTNATLRKRARA